MALLNFISLIMKYTLPNEKYARRIGVKIGSGCRILTKNFGSEPFLIAIGDNVTLSGNVTFINHDGSGWLYNDELGRRYLFRRIEIGSDVFVGANSILMPGVRVGDRVVIGAGSIVTKSIPSGVVVAGNPARFICDYEDLMGRVGNWRSQSDIPEGKISKEAILAIIDNEFKPPLSYPPRK